MFSDADHAHMERALALAARGLLTTRPNPRVGCVIVRDGEIVGEGHTAPAGGAHAEVQALAMAGERAAGATLYVTLEPCSHFGRTPPCADAVIRARPARVVVAARDPHAAVDGAGIARLQAAGICVEQGLGEAESRALNPGFMHRHETGLPWVRLKVAASMDGRTAMASGESQWITGPEARVDVQRLRARSCAIVTGRGTVTADDPRLTVRPEAIPELTRFEAAFLQRQPPLRVVLDGALQTSPRAALFSAPGVVIAHGRQQQAGSAAAALASAGASLLPLPDQAGRLDLRALLLELAARDCNEVLFECGPRLAGAVLDAGLVNELWLYQAPMLLGSSARPLAWLQRERLADVPRWRIAEVRRIGDDLRCILNPVPETPA